MKKIIFPLALLLFLSACSSSSVNENNAKKTAEYIKNELELSDDIVESKEEVFYEIRDAFSIGEHITVISDEDGGLEQVNFVNTDAGEIEELTQLMDFPETDTVDGVLEQYMMDIAFYGSPLEAHSGFVINEGTGLYIQVKDDILQEVQGDKPFSLSFIFNEDRFDQFKEFSE